MCVLFGQNRVNIELSRGGYICWWYAGRARGEGDAGRSAGSRQPGRRHDDGQALTSTLIRIRL